MTNDVVDCSGLSSLVTVSSTGKGFSPGASDWNLDTGNSGHRGSWSDQGAENAINSSCTNDTVGSEGPVTEARAGDAEEGANTPNKEPSPAVNLDVKGAKTEAEAPATVQQAAPPLTTLRNITKTPVAAKRAAPPAKAKPQHPPEVEGVKAPLPAAKKGRKPAAPKAAARPPKKRNSRAKTAETIVDHFKSARACACAFCRVGNAAKNAAGTSAKRFLCRNAARAVRQLKARAAALLGGTKKLKALLARLDSAAGTGGEPGAALTELGDALAPLIQRGSAGASRLWNDASEAWLDEDGCAGIARACASVAGVVPGSAIVPKLPVKWYAGRRDVGLVLYFSVAEGGEGGPTAAAAAAGGRWFHNRKNGEFVLAQKTPRAAAPKEKKEAATRGGDAAPEGPAAAAKRRRTKS